MSLIRGIRSISYGYMRDFIPVPETEENIQSYVTLETNDDDENCYVKLAENWPDFISLNARMIPTKITTNQTFVERFENGVSLGKNAIYTSPKIHYNSGVKNHLSCCSKISIIFENHGEYFFAGKKNSFFGKIFEEYELKFKRNNDLLFEKDFLTLNEPVVEKLIVKSGEETLLEGVNQRASHRVYPYGGFFEYGAHPQEIESCVFQINSVGSRTSAIKIWKLSVFSAKYGIDPTADGTLEGGTPFGGIKNFSTSQKISLYDELKNGECTFALTNSTMEGNVVYKSCGTYHVPNTDLITINFTRE